MADKHDQVGAAIFEKLRARFDKMSVGDDKAQRTTDPEKARYFNFNYVNNEGDSFGNVSVSITDDDGLKVFYGKNITAEMDEVQRKEWYDFLRDLRMFAMRNMLSFDTRDISRSSLRIQDLKQMSKADRSLRSDEVDLSESALFGTSKTSYKRIGENHRLIIRHSGAVDEAIHGARSRKIHAVYVENSDGERFKLPTNHLPTCEALARHYANGGDHRDDFGKHIIDLMGERDKLRKFIRGARNKTFEDAEANGMVDAAKDRYHSITTMINKIKTPRGYKFYKDEWKPSKTLQDDVDLEALREKFVQKSFDDRLDDALPHVYAAYNNMAKQQETTSMINTPMEEFEQWAEGIVEGTWALPDSDDEMKDLQELMSKPLLAGIDGENAAAALYDVLGDDSLSDKIYDAAKGSPELDVRPIVMTWLEDNMPDVASKVNANIDQTPSEPETPELAQPEPEQPEQEPAPQPQEQPDQNAMPDPEQVAAEMPLPNQQESVDLSKLRKLAGLD